MTAAGSADRRQRRTYVQLAQQLHDLSQRPQFVGKKWDWFDIGLHLGVNQATARHLIQWMRRNYTEMYWTVGTYKTNYQTVPTKLVRDALDGMFDQQKHIITRLDTMVKGWQTLAALDPDQTWRRLAEYNMDHFRSMLNLETSFQENLIHRADGLGWTPPERTPS